MSLGVVEADSFAFLVIVLNWVDVRISCSLVIATPIVCGRQTTEEAIGRMFC